MLRQMKKLGCIGDYNKNPVSVCQCVHGGCLSGWGIAAGFLFRFFIRFLEFPHFLYELGVNPRREAEKGRALPGAATCFTPILRPRPSSCTRRWRTSSVWPLASCASWPRTRRRPTPSMPRAPRPHSWSCSTPAMRAPVRGARARARRGLGPVPPARAEEVPDSAFPFLSAQPPTPRPSCSASPRTRTQITASACPWSSPTPSSSMTPPPGRR